MRVRELPILFNDEMVQALLTGRKTCTRRAIKLPDKMTEEVQQYRAIGTPEELQDMKSNYFEALSDWRQYRKIGTLEECRTAREKQIPKKPVKSENQVVRYVNTY